MEHTGLLFLFTCQPTKSSNFSRPGVNVRAHLLRKNYSRTFSSIRSAPLLSASIQKNVIANIMLGAPPGDSVIVLYRRPTALNNIYQYINKVTFNSLF